MELSIESQQSATYGKSTGHVQKADTRLTNPNPCPNRNPKP